MAARSSSSTWSKAPWHRDAGAKVVVFDELVEFVAIGAFPDEPQAGLGMLLEHASPDCRQFEKPLAAIEPAGEQGHRGARRGGQIRIRLGQRGASGEAIGGTATGRQRDAVGDEMNPLGGVAGCGQFRRRSSGWAPPGRRLAGSVGVSDRRGERFAASDSLRSFRPPRLAARPLGGQDTRPTPRRRNV